MADEPDTPETDEKVIESTAADIEDVDEAADVDETEEEANQSGGRLVRWRQRGKIAWPKCYCRTGGGSGTVAVSHRRPGDPIRMSGIYPSGLPGFRRIAVSYPQSA